MEQWSILSNVVNYVQYDRTLGFFYDLDARAIDLKIIEQIYDRLKDGDREVFKVDLVIIQKN